MGDDVVTCGHCNTVKEPGAAGWRAELGLQFCPDCKDNYWHTEDHR
jgi:hypothetical protein